MPLYDFKCPTCATEFETFSTYEERIKICPNCQGPAKRLITRGASFLKPDAVWLPSVREVLDKESPHLETRQFLETPTRENYRRMMKAEGIRPLEEGEKPRSSGKSEEVFVREMTDKIMRRKKRREAIEVRG